MNEIKSSKASDLLIAHGGNVDCVLEAHILTQKEFDEQIKDYIFLLTAQIKDLTRLIEEMSGVHQTILLPSTGASSNSSAAGKSSDTCIKCNESITIFLIHVNIVYQYAITALIILSPIIINMATCSTSVLYQ